MDVATRKEVLWVGDSKNSLLSFPGSVKKKIGDAIHFAQLGELHPDTKVFKNVGSSVYEIAVKYDKNAYRTVYVAKFKNRLYVLHAFQKKASRGIKTPKKEVDLIKERYKYVKEIEKP